MSWKIWAVGTAAVIAGIVMWDMTTPSLASDPKQECHAIAGYLLWRRIPVVDPIADPWVTEHEHVPRAGEEKLDCGEIFRGAGISTEGQPCDPTSCHTATFSRVRQVSENPRQALVYVATDCPGEECAHGQRVILERYARIWFIVSEEGTWIS